MARLDKIHEAVKNALIKDGWTITDDPLSIKYKKLNIFVDLGAERTIAAERKGEKIAVEIKSFLNRSPVHDFENALGQYRLYRRILMSKEPERKVYLAISEAVYNKVFIEQGLLAIAELEEVSLIITNTEKEEIVKWIKHENTKV